MSWPSRGFKCPGVISLSLLVSCRSLASSFEPPVLWGAAALSSRSAAPSVHTNLERGVPRDGNVTKAACDLQGLMLPGERLQQCTARRELGLLWAFSGSSVSVPWQVGGMWAGAPRCGQPLPWLWWVVLLACPLAWALRDLLNFTPNSVFLLWQILLTGLVRSRGPGCLNLPLCLLFSYL